MRMLLTSVTSIAVLMAVSCVFAVAAESQAVIPRKGWGNPTAGFRISASTEKETYLPCEAINLTLTLENTGPGNAETWIAEIFAQTYRIEVILPTKQKAPLTLWGKRQADLPIISRAVFTLESGKTESASIPRLNQLFDMTVPGEYAIVAQRTLPMRDGSSRHCQVTSNTVVVKILDE